MSGRRKAPAMLESNRGEEGSPALAVATVEEDAGEEAVIDGARSQVTADVLGAFAGDDDNLADDDYPIAPPVIDIADVSSLADLSDIAGFGEPPTESADTGRSLR